jgi:hypothetical protein
LGALLFLVFKICLGWMAYPGKIEDQHHIVKNWQQKVKEPGRTVRPQMNYGISKSVIGGRTTLN